jgi:hypothetical protein
VAQTLPVDWNGMLGMFDTDVIPRYEGRREVGEGHGGEGGERGETGILNGYRRSATNVRS